MAIHCADGCRVRFNFHRFILFMLGFMCDCDLARNIEYFSCNFLLIEMNWCLMNKMNKKIIKRLKVLNPMDSVHTHTQITTHIKIKEQMKYRIMKRTVEEKNIKHDHSCHNMIIVIISKAKIYFMCDLIAEEYGVKWEWGSTENGEMGRTEVRKKGQERWREKERWRQIERGEERRRVGIKVLFICGSRAFYTPNSPIYDGFCNSVDFYWLHKIF